MKTDIILVHADDDFDILSQHSLDLFDSLLEPSLPPSTLTPAQLFKPLEIAPEEWAKFREVQTLRQHVREDLIHSEEIVGFGTVSQFKRADTGTKVVLVETKWGGHDSVGRSEGVIDIIGNVLDVKRIC